FKPFFAESLGILPYRRHAESFMIFLKVINCSYQAFDVLLPEENSCFVLDNGLTRPSPPICDNGRSAGLSFNREDAEILFSRENKGLSPLHISQEHIARLMTQKFNISGSLRFYLPEIRAIAGHNEFFPRHF